MRQSCLGSRLRLSSGLRLGKFASLSARAVAIASTLCVSLSLGGSPASAQKPPPRPPAAGGARPGAKPPAKPPVKPGGSESIELDEPATPGSVMTAEDF